MVMFCFYIQYIQILQYSFTFIYLVLGRVRQILFTSYAMISHSNCFVNLLILTNSVCNLFPLVNVLK